MTFLTLNILSIYLSIGLGVCFSLTLITKGFEILCLCKEDNVFKSHKHLFMLVLVLLWPVFIYYSLFDKDDDDE